MVDIHSATPKNRGGKKKKERRKKPQVQNIMSASVTQGCHKMNENVRSMGRNFCSKN